MQALASMAPLSVHKDNSIAIFYGSQTGTAEEVAWDLMRQGNRQGYICSDPLAMDDATLPELCTCRFAIFVVATTGQGDPPSNMKKLWQELVDASLPRTLLSRLRYTVFGLGDSHYREFNYAARKLFKRLEGLGAQPFFRIGLGDDQHDFGMEQELDPWAEDMWPALSKILPPSSVPCAPSSARYTVEILDTEATAGPPCMLEEDFSAEVVQNSSLCSEAHSAETQDVINVSLRAPPGHDFVAGDVCVVWPEADPGLVRRFVVEVLELDLRTTVRIRAAQQNSADNGTRGSLFPDHPLTVRDVFTYYVDISAVPTRHFFEVLAEHTTDEIHITKLKEFASRTLEAKDALYEYCKRERRSAAEVMWDFWTARPPLAELLSALPVMRPRRYSIASGPSYHSSTPAQSSLANFWVDYQRVWGPAWRPKLSSKAVRKACQEALSRQANEGCTFDLCVAVVAFTTKTGRECSGLCSAYLKRGSPEKSETKFVRCSFEPGTLALPPLQVPLIFVCPGTGLSPCRSLVHERHSEVTCLSPSGLGRPKDLMFLGFRHKDGDFLYGDEWPRYHEWLQVHIAFSRDDPNRKIYVQDLIEQNGAHVCELLDLGARIYVCGKSHPMPSQVFDSFAEALHDHRGMSLEQAAAKLRELQRAQRYVCDTWG